MRLTDVDAQGLPFAEVSRLHRARPGRIEEELAGRKRCTPAESDRPAVQPAEKKKA